MGKLRGSVSLFTAMIFLVVVSVIMATINSARVHAASVMVSTALTMGLDSTFACYDSELFSEFGVLLTDGSYGGTELDKDRMALNINEYMSYNIDTKKDLYLVNPIDLYGVSLSGVSVDRVITAVDGDGLIWQNMAVEYEKYAKPISLAADYLGYEEAEDESTVVVEASEKIMNCTETILTINTTARQLVQYIDGVKCSEDGINLDKLSTVSTFVKQFCPTSISMDSLNIESPSVFNAIKGNCTNAKTFVDNAANYANDGDLSAAKKEINKLKSHIEKNISAIDDALEIVIEIEESAAALEEEVSELQTYINENGDVLSDEVFGSILEETESIGDYNSILANDLCDVATTKVSLSENKEALNAMLTDIDGIDYDSSPASVLVDIDKLKTNLAGITFDGMIIKYDRLTGSGYSQGVLDMLEAFFDDGILMLVIPEGDAISSKTLSQTDLPSLLYDFDEADEYQDEGDAATIAAKRIIYTEYVLDHFASYTDKNDSNAVNYEAEYILFGKKSDQSNLSSTVTSIALMRSGFNMMYIITDSEKKNEAYTLALALVGFTGIDAVVRLVQYTLLYLWSYAEGLSDAKTLLAGGSVPLTKNTSNWQLSLKNLMSKEIKQSDSKEGFSYEDYLRMLFYTKDDGKKSAYTMDLVQVYMQTNYNENFQMRNYVYGVEATTGYTISGMIDNYSEKAGYTY